MNLSLFKYLNSFAGIDPAHDKLIIFFASTLAILLVVGAVIFLFLHTEGRKGDNAWSAAARKFREIFFVFVVCLIALGVSTILKNLIHAARPYDAMSGIMQLIWPSDPYSFPSGHATFFAALATALYLYHKRLGLIFGAGTLLIGLARVVSGIHYPADILTGFVVGILIAFTVAYLRKKV